MTKKKNADRIHEPVNADSQRIANIVALVNFV
jgi:hypothetical protein